MTLPFLISLMKSNPPSLEIREGVFSFRQIATTPIIIGMFAMT